MEEILKIPAGEQNKQQSGYKYYEKKIHNPSNHWIKHLQFLPLLCLDP